MSPIKSEELTTRQLGSSVPFENINDAGCYVANWSGHLVRVPEDGVKPGRSPLIELRGREVLFVTKLSDDPYIPISKARMLAANLDLSVNF
jgi:hypothetical protein